MVFGPIIGAGLGALAGAGVGALVFSGDRPRDMSFLNEAADRNPNIRVPAAAAVTDDMRAIIPLTPEWTYWPDYDRWVMINRLLRTMWPNITRAILLIVLDNVKWYTQKAVNGMHGVLGIIEDITLGPYSVMDAEHLDPHIQDKYFTLGDFPTRVAGMKVYHTADETCIMELPLLWGSNAAFDINVYLKLPGGLRVVLPLAVRDINFKATLRLTCAMVDVIPCIGGVTASFLSLPHVDFKMYPFDGAMDVMALPGMTSLMNSALEYVFKQLLLYPNSVSYPLFENFGCPDPPRGMLHVRLHRIEGLKSTDLITKGDSYVVFEVREGRAQRSRVVKNCANPEFEQDFYLLVDDLVKQRLSIKCFDLDPLCPTDDLLGNAELYFTTEAIESDVDEAGHDTGGQRLVYEPQEWIRSFMTPKRVELPLREAGSKLLKNLNKLAKATAKAADTIGDFVMGGGGDGPDERKVTIQVAKTRKEVREQQEADARAEMLAEAAAKQAADAKALAEKRKAAEEAGGEELERFMAQQLASTTEIKWTDEDEAAFWAEVKRLADEDKAKAAAEAKRRKALTQAQRDAEDAAREAAAAAAAAADAELVLVQQEVALRGNGPQDEAKSVGTIVLTLQFMPFEEPRFDDDIELKPLKSGLSAYLPAYMNPPKPREFQASINDFQKGVLSVTIFKASALGVPGAITLSPDPYVEMTLVDCDRLRPSETQKSTVKYNDSTPRWIETFDFVMISAGSMLNINVMNKVTMMDMVASLKVSKSRFQDSRLGRVQIPVRDVARNGVLKDTWALQDAESGTIEMRLAWTTCFVDEYVD